VNYIVWKTTEKDTSEACAIVCQSCSVSSGFPSGMTSHSKIAQFNWECIGRFREYHGLLWVFTLVTHPQIIRYRLSTLCTDVITFCMTISGSICITLALAEHIKIFLKNNIHIQFLCRGCVSLKQQPSHFRHVVYETNTFQCKTPCATCACVWVCAYLLSNFHWLYITCVVIWYDSVYI
jgi:hypothetical protein